MKTTYEITTSDISYKFVRETDIPYEGYVHYIVGKNGACIDIIYSPDFPEVCELHGVGYHDYCLINKKIERGMDVITFIKSCLLFTVQNLEHDLHININKFEVSDASTFICYGQKINLSSYNLLIYGYTWYSLFHKLRSSHA